MQDPIIPSVSLAPVNGVAPARNLQQVKGRVGNEGGADSSRGDITRGGPRVPTCLFIPYTDGGQADETAR